MGGGGGGALPDERRRGELESSERAPELRKQRVLETEMVSGQEGDGNDRKMNGRTRCSIEGHWNAELGGGGQHEIIDDCK